MFKIGNWKYLKSNNTLNFKSKEYSYEIDLDRNITPEDWLKHLLGKNNKVMPDTDLRELMYCYEQLGYQVDKEKVQKLFDFWKELRN